MRRGRGLFLSVFALSACQAAFGIEQKTAAVEPASPDAALTPGGACEAGSPATCDGNAPRTCVEGAWVASAACAGAVGVCVDGVCRSNRSCAAERPGAGVSCGTPNDPRDCCESPVVAGGTFIRNYDGYGEEVPTPDGGSEARLMGFDDPRYPATVSTFRMDTFEVTTGRFRVFVETSGGTQDNPPAKGAGMHPKIAGSGWLSEWNERLVRDRRELTATLTCGKQLHDPITWTDAPGPYESHPALCVTWYEAFAFCAWDGGRLPTDAEMNYAAAGGSEQRLHPWGNVPTTHSHAVVECRRPDCLPAVGSRPLGRGKWGHEDLIGSAQEWVLDIDDWPKVPCVDCAAVLDWSSRLTRGGSYDLIPQVQGYSAGSHSLPAVQRLGVGFRCARSP